MILNLSFPAASSVNDRVSKELSSLCLASVDDAAYIIATLGRRTELAKMDIAHAYRNVPVHPDDWFLLGMQWGNVVFLDTALPFGLRSALKIFSTISDALEWILAHRGITSCLHYIDDVLTMGAPDSGDCAHNLQLLLSTCEKLGIPVASHKVEGPPPVWSSWVWNSTPPT